MVNGGEIDVLGGGYARSSTRGSGYLGAQWASLFLGEYRATQSHQARSEEVHQPKINRNCGTKLWHYVAPPRRRADPAAMPAVTSSALSCCAARAMPSQATISKR